MNVKVHQLPAWGQVIVQSKFDPGTPAKIASRKVTRTNKKKYIAIIAANKT